jgi:hypothetical protein
MRQASRFSSPIVIAPGVVSFSMLTYLQNPAHLAFALTVHHASSCIALDSEMHSGFPCSSSDNSTISISQHCAATPEVKKLEEQCGKMGSCYCGIVLL